MQACAAGMILHNRDTICMVSWTRCKIKLLLALARNLCIWISFTTFVGEMYRTARMRKNVIHIGLRRVLLCVFCFAFAFAAHAFTVVIDAGHGGRDPGALGARVQEKTLNLEVSKRLADQIKQNHKDVKVLLTRSTDVFLTLQERANFVNKNHADLFICIHTNAADNKSICGAETFVLGLNKMDSNLDVAMRENAVMMLEDDYQTKYQGFDPNSVESYIMFEFMQDQYIDKSLQFAQLVQTQFSGTLNRADRGVRQAAFWVLHQSACPSVLVEMGFISNAAEEKYLASEAGKAAISKAIYDAFVQYKAAIDKTKQTASVAANEESAVAEQPWEKPALQGEEKPWKKDTDDGQTSKALTKDKGQKTKDEGLVPEFRVQIFSSRKPLPAGDATFKGLKGCKYTQDGEWCKYTYGSETDYKKIQQIRKELSVKFKDCFIVAFLDGEQIYVKDALKLIDN